MIKKTKKTVKNIFTNPPVYLNIFLGVAVLGLVSIYLWQVNSTTQLGIELQKLKKQKDTALELNRDLKLSVAQYKSIANLQDRLSDLSLAQVDELDYIQMTTVEPVAKR